MTNRNRQNRFIKTRRIYLSLIIENNIYQNNVTISFVTWILSLCYRFLTTMHRKSSSPKKANKSSPQARPRRRASQTYIIKYQLARNPLKAEEEDLKLALLASLQQCNGTTPKAKDANGSHAGGGSNNKITDSPSTSKSSPNSSKTKLKKDGIKKLKSHGAIPNGAQPLTPHTSTITTKTNGDSSGAVGKLTSKKSDGKIHKSSGKKAKLTNGRHKEKLVKHSIDDVKNSKIIHNNNNHTANYSTTSRTHLYLNSHGQYAATVATAPYSPYTPIQKKEPPDEDYLRKYKPETEDFLTFICFRTTAPNYNNFPNNNSIEHTITNGVNIVDDGESNTNTNVKSTNMINGNQTGKNGNYNLKKRVSPLSISYSSSPSPDKLTQNHSQACQQDQNGNSNGNKVTDNASHQQHQSPNHRRRPIRQSPRLATRQSKRILGSNKISETDHTATAYDNSIDYEEELKRASIALEDMAQEINSSDGVNDNEGARNTPDVASKTSSGSPMYKNNRHLVKGLMTREFAGAFADEETIFESISNHKL